MYKYETCRQVLLTHASGEESPPRTHIWNSYLTLVSSLIPFATSKPAHRTRSSWLACTHGGPADLPTPTFDTSLSFPSLLAGDSSTSRLSLNSGKKTLQSPNEGSSIRVRRIRFKFGKVCRACVYIVAPPMMNVRWIGRAGRGMDIFSVDDVETESFWAVPLLAAVVNA
jgi:hypothetical protein